MLEAGPDAWAAKRVELQDAALAAAGTDAADGAQGAPRPYPEPTAAQQAILARREAVPADTPLGALMRGKRRPTQKTLERVLQVMSDFDSAQRPLRAALVRTGNAGLPFDDSVLLGCAGLEPALCRAAFGCVDPDARTPALRVPRRLPRLAFAAPVAQWADAAEAWFRESGLPEHSRLPAAAIFFVPDVPVCTVRFPTHREVLIRALEESGTMTEGTRVLLKVALALHLVC